MAESRQLLSAREHLARAEANYRSGNGLLQLEQAWALLEEAAISSAPDDRTVARNLAAAYSARILGAIKNLVETDRGLPEPDLEHLFKVVLAFDQGDFDLPADARSIKISLARRLIDHYYEGHSPAQKEKALQQLVEISGGRKRRSRKEGRT
ncbi:MAG: hypothetical protein ACREV5_13025 [Steroidobacter sp.]